MFQIEVEILDSNGHAVPIGSNSTLDAHPFSGKSGGGQFFNFTFHCSDRRAKKCIKPICFLATKHLKDGPVEVKKGYELLSQEWEKLLNREIKFIDFQKAILAD